MAVTAGMRYPCLMRALGAFDQHLQARLRAAVLHRREGAIVLRCQLPPVLRQEVCLEGVDDSRQPDHLIVPPVDGEALHQAVDAINGVMRGLVGQVGVANGGENGLMAEDLLHLDQINAGFNQMGCVAVA